MASLYHVTQARGGEVYGHNAELCDLTNNCTVVGRLDCCLDVDVVLDQIPLGAVVCVHCGALAAERDCPRCGRSFQAATCCCDLDLESDSDDEVVVGLCSHCRGHCREEMAR